MSAEMSERDLARQTIRTLHQLARLCGEMFRSQRTRKMIRDTEVSYHRELMAYDESMKVVSDSARLAWLELDEDCRNLLRERGSNPDVLLEWLNVYPQTVLTTILGPQYAEKPRETAKTR